MAKGDAERIRDYLCREVERARSSGEERVKFRSGDLAKAIGIENRFPNVCQVMRGEKFLTQCRVETARVIEEPPQRNGANLVIEYRILP